MNASSSNAKLFLVYKNDCDFFAHEMDSDYRKLLSVLLLFADALVAYIINRLVK